jgi:biopolymer transport protein TolR
MGPSSTTPSRKKTPPIAQINITPLVDVMLVLLVIFMITAPMLQQGVNIALPKVAAKPLGEVHEQLVLAITSDGSVRLDGAPVAVNELSNKLTPIIAADPDRSVHVRADKEVPYGRVAEVMAAVQRAGAKKIGMVTEPSREAQ